jgi:predicted nucleic acid-binding protein
MTLVIDASVAAKWVLPEIGADRAAKLREQDDDFIAPALIVSEIGNAIWKRVMWHEMPVEDGVRAGEIAVRLLSRLFPLEELLGRALEIAAELDHPIYDCFYLALAERERVPLVCADKRLREKAKRLKGIEMRPL